MNDGLLLRSLLVLCLKLWNLERSQTNFRDASTKTENSLYFGLLFNHQQDSGEGNEILLLLLFSLFFLIIVGIPTILAFLLYHP